MKSAFVGFVVLLLSGAVVSSPAATLTVTNSADSGLGTLRQAILDANADASPDLVTIEFNVPGAGVQTIAPLSALPIITRPVTIDGYTQPGASPNTLAQGDNAVLRIELNGFNLSGVSDNGLYVQGSGSTVRGLVINRFAIATGLFVQDSDNNVIEGNFIGTDATGTNVLANFRGIAIYSSVGNRIGGLSPAARNIIGGSSESGISLAYFCSSNQVFGNYIGLGADGLTVVSNNYGIGVTDAYNQIGGSTPGARNIISGNYIGCSIGGGTVIQGNFIGTDASGTLPRGNHYGIHIPESRNNLVGGTGTGEGNVISANESGVVIQGDTASNNVVAGNLIGTDVSGMNALGNIIYGVLIYAPPGNVIGGTNAGARNVIAATTSVGVAILGPNASNNVVAGNFIGTDITGTNALANETGIFISEGKGNRIGGLTPAARNIISGNQYGVSLNVTVGTEILGNFIGLGSDGVTTVSNTYSGVGLNHCTQTQVGGSAPGARNVISASGSGFSANVGGSNVVQGNFIGTDASGALPRGNLNGIVLNESTSNLVGGANAGEGNLISGNRGWGVSVEGINSTGNVVAGNLIGTDFTGTNALGNGDYGVFINSASGNVFGGTNAGARNVISANGYAGIAIAFSPATSNAVQGNFIGLNVTGTSALGNGSYGVLITGAGNTIGGTDAGAGNVISGNDGTGVAVIGADATNNAVAGNFIGTDVTGTNALGNGTGIGISESPRTRIGRLTPAARNTISGNTYGISLNVVVGTEILGNYVGLGADGLTAVPNTNSGIFLHYCSQTRIGGSASGARNVISRNGTGCYLNVGSSNVIQGNFIGTDASGTLPRPNVTGIGLNESGYNLIGGTDAGTGNLLSGNSSAGVSIGGLNASSNVVAGNLIGTDFTGTIALSNADYGVFIGSASGNVIGGTTPGARNVISGSAYAGLAIYYSTAAGNVIQGNFIGVDLTGTNALPGAGFGIVLDSSASGNLIGGTAGGARNVIARNFHGIGIYSGSNNVVQGNFIGVDATGTKAAGNTGYGVYLGQLAPHTVIGGTNAGAGNLISANSYDAISLDSPGCIIQGNVIGTDVTGTNAMFNGQGGIVINDSAAFSQVGGTVAAARNVINGGGGISIYSPSNTVQGNYVGIGADGQTPVGNFGDQGFGITVTTYSQGNLVGGDTPGAGNVVCRQYGDGIRLSGSNNVVQGNFVGTDATGTLARGSRLNGIFINDHSGNLIGGLTPGARNLISGNGNGITVTGTGATRNTIQGNLIGTDVTGNSALPNDNSGVSLEYAQANLVGGTVAGARNVISGNGGYGVGLSYADCVSNVVQGNFVGIGVDGTTPLPNFAGVRMVTGAHDNLIGGTVAGAGNFIAHNTRYGISVVTDGATNNAFLGNNIYSNGWWGIDLGEDGITANDPGDADGSPNHFQNFPEILSALYSNGVLHVSYRVDSTAGNSAYPLTLEFFVSDGDGEGRTFLHRATYSTPQAIASVAFTPLVALTFANRVVATATDANGNTSEFSGEKSLAGWFTVASTADSGPGSLRQAILDANADTSTEPVMIGFSLPGAGVQTLLPLSVLPVITRPVTIDGYTQPGASPNTLAIGSDAVLLIELNGTNFPGSSGLSLVASASNSVVRGLVINRCTYGIGLEASGSILEGNFIGTDATGTNAQANGIGIAISGTGNRIGGLTPGARNVISGNTSGHGIWFTLGTSNLIVGNYVGLGADGTTPVPNAAGIYFSGPSTGNQIGGTTPNARNVISANGDGCYDGSIGGNVFSGNFIGTDASGTLARGNIAGITVLTMGVIGGTNAGAGNLLSGRNSTAVAIGSSNVVAGNFIGTDVTGRLALRNEYDGVLVSGSGNLIGGTTPAARNVIAANRYGIFFFQPTANNNRVIGNYIGTDITGTNGLGNASGIVSLYAPLNIIGGPTAAEGNIISASTNGAIEFIEGATNNIVQGNFIGTDVTGTALLPNGRGIGANTTGNLIGGTGVGQGNIIAGNTGIGVAVGETNNAVLGNRIFANGGLGIDLFGDGVNPNDSSDADSGPNHFQNSPEITSAALAGGNLTVRYRVDSAVANSAYPLTVEFFLADSIASGEGRTFIYRHTYGTPQAFTNITFTPAVTVSDGNPLVATATDANGNTSEFSAATAATSNLRPVVANPIPDQSGTLGSAFSYSFPANTFSDPDAGDTLSYTASGLPAEITFDGPTRTFSGTLTNIGVFVVTVTATDDGTLSLSTNDVFSLTILRAPITVTNLANSGAGSLRQAIADATPGDTIDFAVTGTITLSGSSGLGQLVINKSLTITGPGATNLTIRGNGGTRLFNVTAGSTVISGLTLRSGLDWFEFPDGGGAIRNTAHLTLSNCSLTDNQSTQFGGAVLNVGGSATLIVTGCTFARNWMTWNDGGGAIWNDNVLRITNSTFAENYSAYKGGAVENSGDAVIISSTFSGNIADTFFGLGGGVFNDGTLALRNSIVAGNVAGIFYPGGEEISGTITTGDYNLIQDTNSLVVPGTHNVLGQNPLLSPLRNNGGPTLTCGLASISPALGAADGATSPATDQRGVARPQSVGYDIGAFEGALPPNTAPSVAHPIPDQFTTYQAAFNYTLPADTFSDPDAGQTLTYFVGGVPAGLNFNAMTRTFTGTMQTAGTNAVTVTVRDDGAPPFRATNTFNIIAPKLPITARADDASRIIGQFNPTFTITYFGLAPGDFSWAIDYPPNATTTADFASPAGSYPIMLSGGSDDVYDFGGLTNGTLTVTRYPLRAVAADACRGVGQNNPPLVGVLTGVLYPDNITATYTSVATPTSPPGSYPITPVLNDPDGRLTNYDVTFVNGTLTVDLDAVNPDFQVLHLFGFTNRIGGTAGELIEGSNGWLYGAGGGFGGFGVFKVQKDGTGYAHVRTFASSGDGPVGKLVEEGGVLYGASLGGVWKMNLDGTGFTMLHTWGSVTNDGSGPQSGLLAASDGFLYGTTARGGTNSVGTVFRLRKDGTDYSQLHSFAGTYLEGYNPSALIEGTNGVLYGTASSGGVDGYYDGVGTVFKLNKDGSGFSVIHDFTYAGRQAGGAIPEARLLQGSDGKLYGTTRWGGTTYRGIIFRLDLDGSNFTVLQSLDDTVGANSNAPLIESADGFLYGTARFYGPTSYGGTVFKMDKNGGSFAVLKQFGDSYSDLYGPTFGLLEASDGALYGTASSGGQLWFNDIDGGVFKLNKDGSGYAVLQLFSPTGGDGRGSVVRASEGSDGMIYGTTEFGGTVDLGTVFRMNKNGSGYSVLHSFTGATNDGARPRGEVVEASDGMIYGTTQAGGTGDYGTVFRMEKNGSNFAILRSFAATTNVDGYYPRGGLLEGSDHKLYGTTHGSGYAGNVFSMNKDGTGFVLLHEFSAGDPSGTSPDCTLVEDASGTLYGTTSGGFSDAGGVFKLNKDGSGFVVLHSFAFGPGEPAQPLGGVLLASDGLLYAVGNSGGTSNSGGVFRLNRDGTGFQTLHHFGLSELDGNYPYGAPVEGADGRIYGVTSRGGVLSRFDYSGSGTIYRLNKDGTGYCVLHHFGNTNGSSGFLPVDGKGPFFRGSDGSLYALSPNDDELDFGFVYRLVFPNRAPILVNAIADQNGTYGTPFQFTFATNTFSEMDAGQALSYSASSVPPGITFDAPSRTFSGTPTAVGTNAVLLTATDNGTPLLATNNSFNIVVAKAPLVVAANSTNRTYGVANPPLTGSLTGVTNNDNITATFGTAATQVSPPGDYPITPTLLDPDGKLTNYIATTNSGTLSVNGVTLEFALSGGSRNFCWPTNAAASVLEYTDNLRPPVTWLVVTSGISTNGLTICLTLTPSATVPVRFYRLRLP